MPSLNGGRLRIGEISQRTGVSPELLRAWERRYSLLRPERTSGGFRLYSDQDVERVRRMKARLAEGLSAAEAARLATSDEPEGVEGISLISLRSELETALESYEEERAHRVLDTAIATFTLDAVMTELLLPYLHDLGEAWARGEVTVAQEHFASNLVRGRLMGLARNWDAGKGPRALLACPEGELHDLGLVLFGVALNRRGWRITFLGANTPMETLTAAADNVDPAVVVIACTDPALLLKRSDELADLARRHRVLLGGSEMEKVAERTGAEDLQSDPVRAADKLAEQL